MLEYLKDHIIEEIDGAIDYMEKAIEFKGTDKGCIFRQMSEAEAQHANNLTKIFNSIDKPDEVSAEKYAEMNKSILDKYFTSMGKLEMLKKIYWGKLEMLKKMYWS